MEKNKKEHQVIIFGDSDFAEQVHYQLNTDGRYEVLAFTVDEGMMRKDTFNGLSVIPFQKLKKHYSTEDVQLFPAIGYSKLNTIREVVVTKIEEAGYKLLTYISKHAFIGANTFIGKGCFICEFVSIGIHSQIGKGVVFLPNSRIAHNTKIQDYCYFSNSVAVGGNTNIGRNSFLGMNSTIRDGITIGEYNVIGTASNITKSTEPKGVYVGNPAMKLKDVDLLNTKI